MIQLEFNEEEIEVLTDVVESYLSELRMEIADTDLQSYREGLKSKKEILMNVLDELKKTTVE